MEEYPNIGAGLLLLSMWFPNCRLWTERYRSIIVVGARQIQISSVCYGQKNGIFQASHN